MEKEEKSWYSVDAKHELSVDTLISLYKRYHESMDLTINRFHNIRNYYTIMLIALFGFFGTLFVELSDKFFVSSTIYCLLNIILAGIFVLSIIAYKSTSRYYRAWLVRVTLIAKIENLLGLDKEVKTEIGKPHDLLWNKDIEFMLHRYVEDRFKFKTSKDFIEDRMWKGDNKWARLTFIFFILLSILFSILLNARVLSP